MTDSPSSGENHNFQVVQMTAKTNANTGKKTAQADADIDKILKRLGNSIQLLESAVDGHMENEAAFKDSGAEIQRMGADRVRLAGSLDDAEARCQRLENVNRDVSNRLVNAMETIRSVLEKGG